VHVVVSVGLCIFGGVGLEYFGRPGIDRLGTIVGVVVGVRGGQR
jgi:hypothetical protein